MPDIPESLAESLCDSIIAIRNRRRSIENGWLFGHAVWMSKAEYLGHFKSSDTSPNKYKLPVARRAIERVAVRAVKLLMPNVKWFEVQGFLGGNDTQVADVDNYMRYVLTKKVKSRQNISQLVRCLLLYGLSILKTSVQVKNGNVWPTQRVIDPYSFYVHPETAVSSDDCDIIFEDFMLTYDRYDSLVRKGIGFEPIELSELHKPDWPYHLVTRLAHEGISDPTQDVSLHTEEIKDGLSKASSGFISGTEIWIPKDDGWYQAVIVWNREGSAANKFVRFVKSAYDEPLYRWSVHRPVPNETYTNSMMSDVQDLNTLSNDRLNMFEEAIDTQSNPPFAYDTNMIKRTDNLRLRARAKWAIDGSPREAIHQMQIPDTSTEGLRAWQIYLSLINNLAGAGTIAEGQPGRNMPRAGFAVNALIDLGMSDVQNISELVEQEILTPSLGDIYRVTVHFIPKYQLIKVPGGQSLSGKVYTRDQLTGDFEFEWIGSQQFQDVQMRAQRLLVMLNLLSQPAIAQQLQQQGYVVNMPGLIKMIWRDGLGERGLTDIVLSMSDIQQASNMQSMQTGQNGSNPTANMRLPNPMTQMGSVLNGQRGG